LSKLFATNIRQGWLTAKRLIILLLIVGFSLSQSFLGRNISSSY
jgi:hypothetical protein